MHTCACAQTQNRSHTHAFTHSQTRMYAQASAPQPATDNHRPVPVGLSLAGRERAAPVWACREWAPDRFGPVARGQHCVRIWKCDSEMPCFKYSSGYAVFQKQQMATEPNHEGNGLGSSATEYKHMPQSRGVPRGVPVLTQPRLWSPNRFSRWQIRFGSMTWCLYSVACVKAGGGHGRGE